MEASDYDSLLTHRDLDGDVRHIRRSVDCVQYPSEQIELFFARDDRDDKNDAGMDIQLSVAPSEFENIAGDEDPILGQDHRQNVPILRLTQAQEVDMGCLVSSCMGDGGKRDGKIFIDEKPDWAQTFSLG